MNSLELKVPPVAQVIVTAAAMAGVSKVAPALKFSLKGSAALAVGLGAIGLGSAILGVTQFKKRRPHPIRKRLKKFQA